MDINNLKYITLSADEIDKIDFSQTLITSVNTLRYTNDGLKTFIKWSEVEPDFISTLTSKSIIYNNEEILEILLQTEWNPIPDSTTGTTIN